MVDTKGKLTLKAIGGLYDRVVGINKRNLQYIYPNNPREYFPIADDKVKTKEYLVPKNIAVTETYCVVASIGEINSHWDQIVKLDQFVIKPSRGSRGGGILPLVAESSSKNLDGTFESWNDPSGRVYGVSELRKHLADIIFGVYSFGLWDRALVEYLVWSHKVFTDIYPDGVADVRIIIYKGEAKIAMVRIPTSESNGKANLHLGAVGVSVDLETGLMIEGFNDKGYHDKHPDSGVAFAGIQIPYWKEILSVSVEASKVVPLGYLGVDIVIDRERGVQVMEVNARPGIEIQNVSRKGLLEVLES